MVLPARVLIHATSVFIGAAAAAFGGPLEASVLLLGPSGAGKSDVALRLIAMGGALVSDDQTALFVEDGRLFAEAPSSLYGQIEIRGVGVVKTAAVAPAQVVLGVVLDPDAAIARMPEPASYRAPTATQPLVPPSLLIMRPFEASTPAKIAAAAAACARGGFVAG